MLPIVAGLACSTPNAESATRAPAAAPPLEMEVTVLKPIVGGEATDGRGFHEVGFEARVDLVTRGTWGGSTIRLYTNTTCGPRGVDFAPGTRWSVTPLLPCAQKHRVLKRREMPDFDAYLDGVCAKGYRAL